MSITKTFEDYRDTTDDSTGWCPDHAISMEWIERRASQLIENFQDVDSVYMSEDVYIQFIKSIESQMRYSSHNSLPMGVQIITIQTLAGPLTVKRVPDIDNFCYVGTAATRDYLFRVQMDQMFEEIVLKDCERDG